MFYQSKPFKAMQFKARETTIQDVIDFINDKSVEIEGPEDRDQLDFCTIYTHEGFPEVVVNDKDFIMRDFDGAFTAIPESIFNRCFQKIGDESEEHY